MVNEKAIFEIGNIIRLRKKLLPLKDFFKNLSPGEIIEHCEYKWFKEKHPELCKLAEECK